MGPQGCGTPTLKAFGKEFSAPPLMNAIVSPTGKLLGADILDAGADLLGMNIVVQDKCGKGSGGYGRPILDENGSLTDIVFSNTGGGYLPRFRWFCWRKWSCHWRSIRYYLYFA